MQHLLNPLFGQVLANLSKKHENLDRYKIFDDYNGLEYYIDMNKYRGILYLSNGLSADPSFVGGMASVLDIGVTLQEYNSSKTDNEADTKAIQKDWRAVGEDLEFSIKKYEQKEQSPHNQPKTAPASA